MCSISPAGDRFTLGYGAVVGSTAAVAMGTNLRELGGTEHHMRCQFSRAIHRCSHQRLQQLSAAGRSRTDQPTPRDCAKYSRNRAMQLVRLRDAMHGSGMQRGPSARFPRAHRSMDTPVGGVLIASTSEACCGGWKSQQVLRWRGAWWRQAFPYVSAGGRIAIRVGRRH